MSVSPSPSPPPSWRSHSKAIRHVTILFSDLVGFTNLSEKIGDEQTYELVHGLVEEQERLIERHGGTIRDFAGDGIMALFGAPVASEDAAVQAVSAALEIQARMRELAPGFAKQYGRELELRIGIHTGPAVVGDVSERQLSYSALGDSVNLAARLQSVADPGTVVISAATEELVSAFFECEHLGSVALKGKTEPQSHYRCLKRKLDATRFDVARGRGLSEFVGRDHELQSLVRAFKATGKFARFVSIEGEAGIGKSRLLHEFERSLDGLGTKIIKGDCLAGGNAIPYLPFLYIIRRSLGFGDGDVLNSDAVVRGLENLGLDADDIPYLLNLLAVAPKQDDADGPGPFSSAELVRLRTRQALLHLIASVAGTAPAVLMVEDAHWIDGASEDVLAACLKDEGLSNLLVIATMRPGYTPPWGVADDRIRLTPLGATDAQSILANFAKAKKSNFSPDFLKFAVEKADGNPLFAEEIANYWLAHTKTSPDENPEFKLPSSLENLLLARVDTLDEAPKSILRIASVFGRYFSTSLVEAAGGKGDHFGDDLGTLERREFVYQAKPVV